MATYRRFLGCLLKLLRGLWEIVSRRASVSLLENLFIEDRNYCVCYPILSAKKSWHLILWVQCQENVGLLLFPSHSEKQGPWEIKFLVQDHTVNPRWIRTQCVWLQSSLSPLKWTAPIGKWLWLLLWTVTISHSNRADDVMAFLSLITGPAPSSNYSKSAFWKVIYRRMGGEGAVLGPCTCKWRESLRTASKLSYSIIILFNTISLRTRLFAQ